jgi:hypothetical protein
MNKIDEYSLKIEKKINKANEVKKLLIFFWFFFVGGLIFGDLACKITSAFELLFIICLYITFDQDKQNWEIKKDIKDLKKLLEGSKK